MDGSVAAARSNLGLLWLFDLDESLLCMLRRVSGETVAMLIAWGPSELPIKRFVQSLSVCQVEVTYVVERNGAQVEALLDRTGETRDKWSKSGVVPSKVSAQVER